jgi:acyl-CoA synthetase (AMP-forming)/AMP-acid ligase II
MKGTPAEVPKVASLHEALEESARGEAGLFFVRARGEKRFHSWAELRGRAQRVAGALVQRGVRRGDRIALVLPTSVDFADAFFGALLAGAVPVPLYPPVRLSALGSFHDSCARMVRAAGARLLLSDARLRVLLGEVCVQARPALGECTVAELLNSGAPQVEVRPGASALSLIQFSSGSTMSPKPVALTHENICAQLAALSQLFSLRSEEPRVGVSWLPLYHDMGLIGGMLLAAYYPGTLVLLPPEQFLADPLLWLSAISAHRASVSAAPCFAYGLVVKRAKEERLAGLDLSSWRYALCGAELVSRPTLSSFARRLQPYGFRPEALMPVYGLSEASLVVTACSPRWPLSTVKVDAEALARQSAVQPGEWELASVGVPVPGVEVELRVEARVISEEGQVGEIFMRGPSVMRGYFERPEATSKVLREGWLDTGDLGFWRGGELYICGRSKEVLVLRGANYPPQFFEECLAEVPGARAGGAVAASFLPSPEGPEELLLLVEGQRVGAPPLVEDIVRAVVQRTGIRPHTVVVLKAGALPRTSSGKLRRLEALRQYLSSTLGAQPSRSFARGLLRSLWGHARSALAGADAGGARGRP